jgi:next-to-BRCA1 protein 1
MARFVRDVTFPDGTVVQPGSVFLKTWRVRNDGSQYWPEGIVLGCAGGDVLIDQNTVIPVPAVPAGGEVEITIQLVAPEATGRFQSYFRMRTADGQFFGQRLWADVRVSEDEAGWHMVNGMLISNNQRPTPTPASTSVADEPVGASEVKAAGGGEVDEEAGRKSIAGMTAATATASAGPADPISGAPSAGAPVDASMASVQAVWVRVWAKELQLLSEMGFSDPALLLPLLQEHVGVPVSLCPELQGHPPSSGMQAVVAALLGMSQKQNN